MKLRILIIAPFFPYPCDSGGKTRLYYLIRELSIKHDLTLLSLIAADDKANKKALDPYCRSITVPITAKQKVPLWQIPFSVDNWREALLKSGSLIHGSPIASARLMFSSFRSRLERLVLEETFDLVQIDYSQMADYARFLPPLLPKILTAVEVAHITAERKYLSAAGVKRVAARIDYRRKLHYEQRVFNDFSAVIAVSNNDATIIKNISPHSKVFITANGVSDDLFSVEAKPPNKPRIIFIGGAEHEPNVDGLNFFLSGAWLELKRCHPEIKLRIIGSGWRQQSWLTDYVSIEIIDYVEHLSECYQDATFLIAPIRIGSGTRLKILEAMAAGLPVVSTTVGCEGLEVNDGRHILLANDTESLFQAANRIIVDHDLVKSLTSNARKHVKDNYLWSKQAMNLSNAYDYALSTRKEVHLV